MIMNCCLNVVFSFVESQDSVSCYKCDDADIMNCGLNLASGSAVETCKNSNLGCFVAIYKVTEGDLLGFYTKRGCMENYNAETCQGDSCLSCTGENCNLNVFPADRHKCLKCAGDDCDAPTSKYCSIYNPSMTNCVTMFDEGKKTLLKHVNFYLTLCILTESNVISKNCLSDIPNVSKDLCKDNTYLDCEICTGFDCNTNNVRAGTKCYQCTGLECLNVNVADIVDCSSSCYVGINGK